MTLSNNNRKVKKVNADQIIITNAHYFFTKYNKYVKMQKVRK